MKLSLFEAGGSLFAVPAEHLLDSQKPSYVTPLPHAPPMVEGLVNIGGQATAQVNLMRRLGLDEREPAAEGVLALYTSGDHTFACRVDRVIGEKEIDEHALVKKPFDGDDRGPARSPAVTAKFERGGETVYLLDTGRMGLDDYRPPDLAAEPAGFVGLARPDEFEPERPVEDDGVSCLLF